jgi:peptidoglycan hydrolase CwlO-like protein
MKPLGTVKKTKTKVEGHQECGVCHPQIKGSRTSENREAEQDIQEQIEELRESISDIESNIRQLTYKFEDAMESLKSLLEGYIDNLRDSIDSRFDERE